MSIQTGLGMPDAQRRELLLALDSMAAVIEEARRNLQEHEDVLALAPLDLIHKGILPVRNGIGQWHNRVLCPECGLEGPNLVALRQPHEPGLSVAQVGFRCQHCKHEWGFM